MCQNHTERQNHLANTVRRPGQADLSLEVISEFKALFCVKALGKTLSPERCNMPDFVKQGMNLSATISH